MTVTVVERTPKSKIVHIGDEISTVNMTGVDSNHNFIQVTNLTNNRVSFTIDGTTPAVPSTNNPTSFGNGIVVPENTLNGGLRAFRYANNEFSSLKFAAAASGTQVIVEVCRVGPVATVS